MVKNVSQQEAAPLSAEELVEDAPRERVVATRREIKGKSASLATPQSTRAAVERRADQVRQRLREIDPMSLGTAKVQSAIGREEEQHKKKKAAAEQAAGGGHALAFRGNGRQEWKTVWTSAMIMMGGVGGIAVRPLGTTGVTGSPRSQPRQL